MTIRMGAAHWDVTINSERHGDLHFNLRRMKREERGKFHGMFMSSIRKSFRQQKAAA